MSGRSALRRAQGRSAAPATVGPPPRGDLRGGSTLETVVWKTISSVLGVVSALVLHVVIWTVMALFWTLGLAVADASEAAFYLSWAFFAGVVVAGTVLTVRWGRQGRRWPWRITVSWTLLFVLSELQLSLTRVISRLSGVVPATLVMATACVAARLGLEAVGVGMEGRVVVTIALGLAVYPLALFAFAPDLARRGMGIVRARLS